MSVMHAPDRQAKHQRHYSRVHANSRATAVYMSNKRLSYVCHIHEQCCICSSLWRLHLQVSYQGWRRFKLLTVDHDSKPYPMAAATWMDDDTASLSQEQQAATYALEQQVYGLLQQVASYMRQLEQGSAAGAAVAAPASGPTGLHGSSSGSKAQQRPLLPDSVLLFAPLPPSRQQSVADYLIKAGRS